MLEAHTQLLPSAKGLGGERVLKVGTCHPRDLSIHCPPLSSPLARLPVPLGTCMTAARPSGASSPQPRLMTTASADTSVARTCGQLRTERRAGR